MREGLEHNRETASRIDRVFLACKLNARTGIDVDFAPTLTLTLGSAEVEKMTSELESELKENKAALEKSEKSLVTLGEELDKSVPNS